MFARKTHTALMLAASAALLGGCATYGMDDDGMDSASAQGTVMVGGAAMYPTRNIVENAVNSQDHTTLVAAVKAAGLVDTLLKPENKPMLTKVLTYHVVPGRVSASELMQMIRDGNGMARLTTVEGGTLTAKMMGGNVVLVDEMGGMATVTQADVFQSNGVIHVTDTVSMPN